jgi:outer membrane lipoprotein-sorting protein
MAAFPGHDWAMRNFFRRGLIAGVLALVLLPHGALADPKPSAPKLSAADQADVARVEAYLNQVRVLKAGFTQVAPDGSLSDGLFYLSRPGRMRFEYNPPSPILIVGDGTWVVVYDAETKQVDRVPIAATPISVLVRDKVDLGEGSEVTRVRRRPGVLEVSLVDPDNRDQGSITLVFADKPLELRQWLVTDSQNQITTVQLHDVVRDVRLEAKLFVFNDPPGVTQRMR